MNTINKMINVTKLLIVLYVLCFVTIKDKLKWGFSSKIFWTQPSQEWYKMITHTFMHTNLMHLVFNCYTLWQFGNSVESAMGSWSYILFYIGAIFVETLIYALLNSESAVISIGASGIISSIMAVYFLVFKQTGSLYRVFQNEMFGLLFRRYTNINYASHIIGFIVGAVYYFAKMN